MTGAFAGETSKLNEAESSKRKKITLVSREHLTTSEKSQSTFSNGIRLGVGHDSVVQPRKTRLHARIKNAMRISDKVQDEPFNLQLADVENVSQA